MIDLLKEQVYHGNMVSSIATDNLDQSDNSDGSLDSCSVSMTTKNLDSQDSIITQLSLLQQQLSSQQHRQSQHLKYTINEVSILAVNYILGIESHQPLHTAFMICNAKNALLIVTKIE